MPSLNALREFKASFHDIGGEKADLEVKNVPFDDLELPVTEPEPMENLLQTDDGNIDIDTAPADTLEDSAEDFNLDDLASLGIDDAAIPAGSVPEDTPPPAAGPLGGDLDFSAFTGTRPDDLPVPPVQHDDIPIISPSADGLDMDTDFGDLDISAGAELPDTADAEALDEDLSPALSDFAPEAQDADDFGIPDELLAGLSDELESTPPDFPDESPADTEMELDGEGQGDGGDFDLNSLGDLGDLELSEDFPEPAAADDFGLDEAAFDLGSETGDGGFNLDETLDDTGGEAREAPVADAPGEEADELNLDAGGIELDSENLDLGDLGDLGLSEDSLEPAAADDFGLDEAAFDLGSETGDGGFNLDETLDDTGGEAREADVADAPAEEADELNLDAGGIELDSENLDLGDLGDLGLSEDSPEPAAADDFSLDDDAFDLGDVDLGDTGAASGIDTAGDAAVLEAEFGEDLNLDAMASDGGSADSFDNFDLGGDSAGDGFAVENKPEDSGGDDDFSLPGLDDLLSDSLEEKPKPRAADAKTGTKKSRAKAEEEPENIEDIRLSDNDLDQLRLTLSAYPLNLRVACEELIVEQIVDPGQMAKLVRLLVRGVPAKETATLAGKILDRTISIPRGFEKSTGEALEAEQASFAYIFVHNFLPVLRLFMFIAVVAASLFYLIYTFVYTPLKAESIYKIGYERISAGEYQRANERFSEAFAIKRKKDWFYKYAEAFRDERQYMYAEQKYDELLRFYPRDKKGILDYAALETYYLRNYAKADTLLRRELLDYAPDDPEGLLAAGDNSLAWGEVDPSKYEDARYSYARLLEKYGWSDPVVERMMKYFIRTDNLKEVLPLKNWFESNPKRKLSAESMAELGGYLLDKMLEEARGVPNAYVEQISGVRDLLLKAVMAGPSLPEGHYHLARYYHSLGSVHEERVTLELAIRAFDNAQEESICRLNYRIDAHQRYADVLINSKEFIPAEEQLVKGINLYEDALARRLMSRSPKYGRLYAGLGDLEYFTKTGDMETALGYYHRARQNGYAPPEMQYRMGAAYYQTEDWKNALEYFFAASADLPLNRKLLFALGNASLKRGDYFAAQGYYNRLLDILETQRTRLPVLLPNDRPEYLELAERLMMARNNSGVAYEGLASQTGDRRYRSRAMALYAEADRAWDARTRDPRTMIRSGATPLPYLNSRNSLYPQASYEPQIFIRIDRDVAEPSIWEELAPLAGFE